MGSKVPPVSRPMTTPKNTIVSRLSKTQQARKTWATRVLARPRSRRLLRVITTAVVAMVRPTKVAPT